MEFCLVPSLPLPHHKLLHGILHTADIKQQIHMRSKALEWNRQVVDRRRSLVFPSQCWLKSSLNAWKGPRQLNTSTAITLPQVTRNYHDQQDSTYPYLHSLAKRRSRISATVDRLAAGYAYIVGPGGPCREAKRRTPSQTSIGQGLSESAYRGL